MQKNDQDFAQSDELKALRGVEEEFLNKVFGGFVFRERRPFGIIIPLSHRLYMSTFTCV